MAPRLPVALFPPRRHLVQDVDGEPTLCLLNRSWPVRGLPDWKLSCTDGSTHLERLTFHYLEFVECLDAALGESILLDWIHRNPPWQPGYWLDSWNSYAVSIRTVCMMQWLAACRSHISRESAEQIAASVVEQIRFLERNLELDICGNHLIRNIKSLLWAGSFFHGAEGAGWYRRGRQLLWDQLDTQFLDDGMHFELSPAYHCQVFADLLECASVLEPADRSRLIQHLGSAAQVISDLTHPDDRISLFSDGGLNMAYLPAQCLSVYEKLGGSRPECRPVFGLASSGYYGIRSGSGYLVFDCGPSCADSLPAHGHGDILAFEWDVEGRRIVVDAGVREYESGPERDWNRSTRAHNTVTVGNRDQCEFVRSFRVGHRAHGRCAEADLSESGITVTGSYTSYSTDGQRVHHTRTISGTPSDFRILDHVTSRVSEPAVSRLLLHHECVVDPLNETCVDIVCGRIRIRLVSESPVHISRAKWSPDFGTEHATFQLEMHYGNTPCETGFTLRVEDKAST